MFNLLLEGLSEKEIAYKLGLSRHTVHSHVKDIYELAGVNSRAELLARFVPKLEGGPWVRLDAVPHMRRRTQVRMGAAVAVLAVAATLAVVASQTPEAPAGGGAGGGGAGGGGADNVVPAPEVAPVPAPAPRAVLAADGRLMRDIIARLRTDLGPPTRSTSKVDAWPGLVVQLDASPEGAVLVWTAHDPARPVPPGGELYAQGRGRHSGVSPTFPVQTAAVRHEIRTLGQLERLLTETGAD